MYNPYYSQQQQQQQRLQQQQQLNAYAPQPNAGYRVAPGSGPPAAASVQPAAAAAAAQAEAYRVAAWKEYYRQQAAQKAAAAGSVVAAAPAPAAATAASPHPGGYYAAASMHPAAAAPVNAHQAWQAQQQAQQQARLRAAEIARRRAQFNYYPQSSSTAAPASAAAYRQPSQFQHAQPQQAGAHATTPAARGLLSSSRTAQPATAQSSVVAAAVATAQRQQRGVALLPKPRVPTGARGTRASAIAVSNLTSGAASVNNAGVGAGAGAGAGVGAGNGQTPQQRSSGWPAGLQRWVQRAFARGTATGQLQQVQRAVHERIAAATRSGALWTVNWDTEPDPLAPATRPHKRGRWSDSPAGTAQQRGRRPYSRSRSRSRSWSSSSSRSYSRSRSRSRSHSPARARRASRWGDKIPVTPTGKAKKRKRGGGRVASSSNNTPLGKKGRRTRKGKQSVGTSLVPNTLAIIGEDGQLDLEAMVVKGTCQELEKPYLRLTKAPDPAEVRPEDVCKRAVERLKLMWGPEADYLYVRDQLKAIRQDLLVQHVRTDFTVSVYELHARIALERGDLNEFNQCQTQLKPLRRLGLGSVEARMEFKAYKLLYVLHRGQSMQLNLELVKLTKEELAHPAVLHALEVRHALVMGDYHNFFRLYANAPNMGMYLLDGMLLRQRVLALMRIKTVYMPHIPVASVTDFLGFTSTEEALEFMKKAGCVVKQVKVRTTVPAATGTAGAGSSAGTAAAAPSVKMVPTLVMDCKASKVAMFKEEVTQADIGDGRAG